MPNDKNEIEIVNGGGPKKADIIIKNTLNIAAKQEDLSEQTRLAVSRIDEAIELFTQNNQDATYIVKQSGEIFTQLQGENSALKQELLYLAKQSENIYAGLAEKITELSEQAKTREDAMAGFADRINDIAEQSRRSEDAYSLIADKLTEIAEQNKRSEEMYAELSARLAAVQAGGDAERAVVTERVVPAEVDFSVVLDKLNDLSEQLKRNEAMVRRTDDTAVLDKLNLVSEQLRRTERAYADLSDRVNDRMAERTIIREKTPDSSLADISEVLDKITRLSEQVRRSDSAHSMLADKFEILSMRVEQYAFENAKNPAPYAQSHVAPVVLSAPAPAAAAQAKEEIDYDKLAEKIASLISAREVISPDYIASKVVEQIVIPEAEAPNVNVEVDADYIASKVVERISVPEAAAPVINIDGEEIADKVAQRLSEMNSEVIATSAVGFDGEEFADMLVNRLSEIQPDEEEIASRVAEKLDAAKAEDSPVRTSDLDEEELAERIARKIETVKAEDLPAADIDEEILAERIAEKLGGFKSEENVSEAVIDEEELANRIARKIGGYGANLSAAAASVNLDEEELADAISLKVGSLKAEDFEILVDDEGCTSISKGIADNLDYNTISNIIADKLREALDLAAVNAPDYEEMAERISEKITVAGINEDAIADKAAAVLSNYLPEFDTDEIADKVTGAVIDVVSAMPQPTVDSEAICNAITEKLIENQEGHDYDIVIDEDGISKITELVTEEIERETGARFDKVEEDIAKLADMVVAPADEEEEYDDGEDYTVLSEVVATEIEKGVAARLDTLEENIAKLHEIITAEPEEVEEEISEESDYSKLSEVVAAEIEKSVSVQLNSVADNVAKIYEYLAEEENEEADEEELAEEEPSEEVADKEEDYSVLSEAVANEVEKRVSYRLDAMEENIAKIHDIIAAEPEEPEEDEASEEEYSDGDDVQEEAVEVDYTALSEVVAAEIEKGVSARLDTLEEKISGIADLISVGEEEEEYAEETDEAEDGEQTEEVEEDYSVLSEAVASEVEKRVAYRLDALEENVSKIHELIAAEPEKEDAGEREEEIVEEEIDYTGLSEAVADEVEKRVADRLGALEENVSKIHDIITAEPEEVYEEENESEEVEEDYSVLSEAVASEVEKRVSCRLDSVEENVANTNARFDSVEESIAKISELVQSRTVADSESSSLSVADTLPVIVAAEIEKGVKSRLDSIEENIAKITELVSAEDEVPEYEEYEVLDEDDDYAGKISAAVADELGKKVSERFDALEENVSKIHELITAEPEEVYEEEETEEVEEDYSVLSEAVANEVEKRVSHRLDSVEENIANTNARFDSVEENIAKISGLVADTSETNARFDKIEENIAKISELVENNSEPKTDGSLTGLSDEVREIKEMLANGVLVAANEAAAVQPAEVAAEEEEQELVTVSDLVEPEEEEEASADADEEFEEEEGEEDDGDDFLIDVLDMDAFSDDELMPGELSDYGDGVDFANMMKFKRSFIARIIQSSDDNKQFYGEVKHALLSYRKVNSNVAWGAERFNKGRETIARMKIRGKTLCLYLALDPNNYKVSVYHHVDVSDNKSVAGTPMMVKVKSPLGVRKAIRLIDEMLSLRNGEKREIPERDYAAMYPYETIEELIDDGLVKDVRKDK